MRGSWGNAGKENAGQISTLRSTYHGCASGHGKRYHRFLGARRIRSEEWQCTNRVRGKQIIY